jgi:DNA polymerase
MTPLSSSSMNPAAMNPARLNLDTRQRAMLLEMGIHVWLPEAPLAEGPPALEGFSAQAEPASAAGLRVPDQAIQAPVLPLSPVSRPAAQRPVTPTPAASAPDGRQSAGLPVASASGAGAASALSVRPETPGGQPAAWLLGEAQPLYAEAAAASNAINAAAQSAASAQTVPSAQTSGARWLVLAETPPTALPGGVLADFSAFDGDAGQLLDNMLRAARLNGAVLALLAPLVRQGAGAVTPEFSAALAALVAQTQPDIVLLMGRLAALALLPTGEPFGKLRSKVHTLHGARAIVTYDAPYLLRTPGDKAKAWADLCLAMSLSAAP